MQYAKQNQTMHWRSYTSLSWNYKDDWYIWQYLNRGELEGYTGGEKYIDLNILNKDKKLEEKEAITEDNSF